MSLEGKGSEGEKVLLEKKNGVYMRKHSVILDIYSTLKTVRTVQPDHIYYYLPQPQHRPSHSNNLSMLSKETAFNNADD